MRISNLEPLRKRALYEEKMSNTLQNLNIGLTENTIVPENSSSIFTDDWWVLLIIYGFYKNLLIKYFKGGLAMPTVKLKLKLIRFRIF